MPNTKLYLLGPPRLTQNDQTIPISLRKAQALVAYLAVTGYTHSRDHLATLLWPEADQRKARTNLRRMIYEINQRIGAGFLLVTAEEIGLDPECDLWVDVVTFKKLVTKGLDSRSVQEPSETPLLDAINLYKSGFMAGFKLTDCPEFDEWQFFQREELRHSFGQLLQRLADDAETRGEIEKAVPFAKRWVDLDPLHEPAHRRLMHLYVLTGQQAAAERQYDECVRHLKEALGVSPEQETTDLFEVIRTRRFPVQEKHQGESTPLAVGSPQSIPIPQVLQTPPTPPQLHNLPAQSTAFVGRQQEVAEISQRLCEPSCRLLTLVGPGGIGKTRLALEVARHFADALPLHLRPFDHGVYFVPLQPIESSEHIVSAITEAINCCGYECRPEAEPLLEFLADKKMLVVLDNFEHLIDAGDFIVGILTAAPNIKILVTSRVALPLQEAWFQPVAGLRFPKSYSGSNTTQSIEQENGPLATEYDAIRLFEQCARRNQTSFSLEKDGKHVVRICQLVDGMPLALELAAAWLKVLSTEALADEIEKSLDLLSARGRQVPERHRSIRAIFDHSWQRLTVDEQAMLKRLSVFRGGCLREAAEAITDATLPFLASLMDKSLIRREQTGRYELHELIRQFAAEHLQSKSHEYEDLRSRHSQYFGMLLNRHEENLKGSEPQKAMEEIGADLDNIRSGWRWAVSQRDVETLNQYVESLYLFYEARGMLQEGAETFRYAIAQFQDVVVDRFDELEPSRKVALGPTAQSDEEASSQHFSDRYLEQRVIGQLFARSGGLEIRLGNLDKGIELMRKAEAILRQLMPVANQALARVLSHLGQELHRQGNYAEGILLLKESLQLSKDVDDQWMVGFTLLRLGQVAEFQGEYIEAEPYFQQSIDVFKSVGEQRFRAFALNNQGRVAYAMGAFGQASELIDAAYQIREALSDQVGLSYSYLDLGRLATLLGDYAKAEAELDRAHDIAQRLGERDLAARCTNALGEVARLVGDYERSESLHKASYRIYQEINVQHEIPGTLTYFGCLALCQGNYADASVHLHKGLELSMNNQNRGTAASALRYLGHLKLWSLQEHTQALDYFHRAYAIALEIYAAPLVLDILVGIARVRQKREEQEQAAELLAQLIQQPALTHASYSNCCVLMKELGLEAPSAWDERLSSDNLTPSWLQLAKEHLLHERLT